ncbi:MAG: DNA polymerase III subunit gamma/tau [Candidatus Melainabacteria bacterium]|nr:DNA polymerase III subunit gamma/tau [Candidatus Melainabacteria bacterium]
MTKYQPLYLKYRPQTLQELVGQSSVVKTLTNALENSRITHAYLFTGPRGTGKTSSARILAKSLNCDNGPTITPCLTCPSCVEIAASSSPSVFEIDAASNNSVDDARSLIERAPLAAQGGKYKIYIVDECHMLTKEAFNALLKTIEEPPPQVVFILATTEEYKVPPTILSRCQRLMFRLANQPELEKHLRKVAEAENINITDDAIQLVCRRSGGGLRDALGLFDQASLLAHEGKPITSQDLLVLLGALQEDLLLSLGSGIVQGDGYAVTQAVNELLGQGREPSLIALELAKHFLNLVKGSYLSVKDSAELGKYVSGSQSYLDGILTQVKNGVQSPELVQIVEQLERLEQSVKRSSLPVMTLEIGLLSICHRHDIKDVNELAQKIEALESRVQGGDFPAPAPQAVSRPRPQLSPQAPSSPPPAMQAHTQAHAQSLAPSQSVITMERVETKEGEMTITIEPDLDELPIASVQSAHEPAAQEPEAEAAPASNPASVSPSVSHASHGDLDVLWDRVLDALQKRNIPAYSVVNMHAFPINQENDVLYLGVGKEFFQKTIESKSHHISQAYKDITGDTITVKVKVVDEAQRSVAPKTQAPKPAPQAPAPRIEESRSASESNSELDSEDDRALPTSSEVETNSEPNTGNKAPSEISLMVLETDGTASQNAKEAYKLFEGPGSRFIS